MCVLEKEEFNADILAPMDRDVYLSTVHVNLYFKIYEKLLLLCKSTFVRNRRWAKKTNSDIRFGLRFMHVSCFSYLSRNLFNWHDYQVRKCGLYLHVEEKRMI